MALCAALWACAVGDEGGDSSELLEETTAVEASAALAKEVHDLAETRRLAPMPAAPGVRPALVELGRALFFDKELSGNRDISCATCHLPEFGSGDGLHLSIGQGGSGLGTSRTHPAGAFIARNAPPLFNLHSLNRLFWDGRVSVENGVITSPAGNKLTAEMKSLFEFGAISVLPLFPVLSREEMRAFSGNELADAGDDPAVVWPRLVQRLQAVPGYKPLFEAAYPGTAFGAINIAHVSNAIGGFIVASFAFNDTPWDRFLREKAPGQYKNILTDAQLIGARNFLNAPCVQCHGGAALSDGDFHNVVLAQLGPGTGDGPLGNDDFGRARVTGNPADRYKFRSTPLRNLSFTAPYGHAGEFNRLFDFIFHYSNNADKLRNYDVTQLPAILQPTLVDNVEDIIARRDPIVAPVAFPADFASTLVTFMGALEDPATASRLNQLRPGSVPSGLAID
jgi:cytochrome c peroxidase